MDQTSLQGIPYNGPSNTGRYPELGTRYAPLGHPGGWCAVAAKVREFDEEKVKDTKEDIDTLLVFAGLFSAVLSAFLVESYQRLLPDTASQTLDSSTKSLLVMRHISLQMANPEYRPVALPEAMSSGFQPSEADVRVNVLWFASLVLSLTTASFSILVKQWLREYLAVKNPSPLARLRLRHYRYPALEQWKVFEIAAFLPLVQQLALSLFFVGLCYFTASVHESVGYTTLPLVTGWAFCFSMITILPVFFPRCPYRTAPTKSLHMLITHSMKRAAQWLYLRKSLQQHSLDGTLKWLWSLIDYSNARCSEADENFVVRRSEADLDILADVDALHSNDDLLSTVILESLQQVHEPSWNNLVALILRIVGHRLQRQEEELAADLPQLLDLRGLSYSAYVGIINILCHAIRMHILSPKQPSSRISDFPETVRVLYILFSPTHHLPQVATTSSIPGVLYVHGIDLIRLLAYGCSLSADSGSSLALFFEGMQMRAEDLDWGLDKSLQYVEIVMDTVFDTARSRTDVLIPAGNFTLDGEMAAWPWHCWPTLACYAATELLANITRRTIHPSLPTAAGNNVRPPLSPPVVPSVTRDVLTTTVATNCRFVGALESMWYLANKSIFIPSGFLSAIEDCLSQNECTSALLKTLSQLPIRVVTRVCRRMAIECRMRELEGVTRPEVLTSVIDELSDTLPPVVHPSPVTNSAINVLKTLCLAIHLPSSPKRAQPWKALFDATLRLFYKSMSIPVTAEFACEEYSEDDAMLLPQNVQLLKIIRTTSQNCDLHLTRMIEACLNSIQRQDETVFPRCHADEQRTYEEWLTQTNDEKSLFDNRLVETLGTLYMTLRTPDSHEPEDIRFFRLRKLGIVLKVRNSLSFLDKDV